MLRTDCAHPARQLLDFYVNDTLDPAERDTVERHLGRCRTCSEEVAELADLAQALGSHAELLDSPRPEAVRRGRAVVYPLAALLGLALSLALLGVLRSTAPEPPPVVEVDLGSGPLRGQDALPVVSLAGSPEAVRIRFVLPVSAGARYSATVVGPGGELVASARAIREWDSLGAVRQELAASALASPGDYAVVVRVEGTEERSYRYPFRVER